MALLLLLLMPSCAAALRAFQNRSELRAAVLAWSWETPERPRLVSTYGAIEHWDVSRVTDMSSLFESEYHFNEDISLWNTSAVTDMKYMFHYALCFNQPIGSWDTSAVTDMQFMFSYAHAFNQPIGSWDTSAVTDMTSMFSNAAAFDASIGSWDVRSLKRHDQMFDTALMPPCEAGRGPDRNSLKCDPCGLGQFAAKGSYCQECPEGSVPSEDRDRCEDCSELHYTEGGDDCLSCNLPFAVVHNQCVWWHLTLVAPGLAAVAIGACLLSSIIRSRRAKKVDRILQEVYVLLWDEPNAVAKYSRQLRRLGLQRSDVEQKMLDMLALQSQRAGVSLRYLLSAEFEQLARQRAGKDDPTFLDLKTAFWLEDDPIGQDIICPRDGRAGCALVDWIPREERREQTHFMSWTWKYSLQQVRSALEMLDSGPDVFFYMCFFINNQYRIIVESVSSGSDNLDQVFAINLKRIGSMIAILDTWENPVYLSRIWTVYEQFVASTIQIEVQFLMPKAAANHLQRHIATGSEGIDQVIHSLSQVDSAQAEAWDKRDEIKVKSMIEETVGFRHVDDHVTDVMTTWIGRVVERTCRELLQEARTKQAEIQAARAR